MRVESRNSPHCLVRLVIVHMGTLGLFELPFEEAVRTGDFTIRKEFETRPLLCKADYISGELKRKDPLTSDQNDTVWNKVCDIAKLPRYDIAWKSLRRGYANALSLHFISENPSISKDEMISKLSTEGNWKGKESMRYVEDFIKNGYGQSALILTSRESNTTMSRATKCTTSTRTALRPGMQTMTR
jgi:hypothetical protein